MKNTTKGVRMLSIIHRNLSKRALWNVRKKVVLNSIYLSDYEVAGYTKNDLFTFFEGYVEFLEDEYFPIQYCDKDFFNLLKKHDNVNSLYEYYNTWDRG